MSARRLAEGGRIDRATPLQFTWDGRPQTGYAGDTLASALLAAGEQVLGRSFKYHRPRGLMSAGVEESGALVTVGSGARRDPNVKATTQELYDGLVAGGQNAWPSVRFDLGPSTAFSVVSSQPVSITRPSWVFRRLNGAAEPACGCATKS